MSSVKWSIYAAAIIGIATVSVASRLAEVSEYAPYLTGFFAYAILTVLAGVISDALKRSYEVSLRYESALLVYDLAEQALVLIGKEKYQEAKALMLSASDENKEQYTQALKEVE